MSLNVGPEASERALAKPHMRPMEFAGRSLRGFVVVDPAGYRTEAAIATWVQRGIEFVSTLPAKEVQRTKARDATNGEQLFRKIRHSLLADPGVSQGTGFGTTPGLRVGTKIFAMASSS